MSGWGIGHRCSLQGRNLQNLAECQKNKQMLFVKKIPLLGQMSALLMFIFLLDGYVSALNEKTIVI